MVTTWWTEIETIETTEKCAPCPICLDGFLSSRTEEVKIQRDGHKRSVTLRYAECSSCGSEITGASDGLANKNAVLAAFSDATP